MKTPDYKNRPVIVAIVSVLLASILVGRLFYLQIIRGEEYTESFEESVTRRVRIPAKRGRILDRNGKVLAESKTVRDITIVDNTGNSREENNRLNYIIQKTLGILSENNESITNDFGVAWNGSEYEFTKEGFYHLRFLADVYGYADTETLSDQEREAGAEDIVLMLADRYRIEKDMTSSQMCVLLLNTVIVRYNLSLNSFQKYVPTVIAREVSDDTVGKILSEHDLDGVTATTNYKRVYYDSEYLSDVTGYISQISSEELSENGDIYSAGDQTGTVGIEASMEETLRGNGGYREISVDNLGREKNEISFKAPSDGNDVYLTIDKDVQIAAHRIVEKNLRDILLAKMTDSVTSFEITEETNGKDIVIPAADVYAAILSNIIDRDHFESDDASDSEVQMLGIFRSYLESVKMMVRSELESVRTPYDEATLELKEYSTYIVRALYDQGVLLSDQIDTDDDVYRAWTVSGTNSMGDFLYRACEAGWVDKEVIGTDSGNPDEVFEALTQYVIDEPCEDYSFGSLVCKYMMESGAANGNLVCRILFDQEMFDPSDSVRDAIDSGESKAAFQYVQRLIRNGDLTPGQLHLYPYSGSVVITDPDNGQVLALVSYPGYDANRIQDSEYMESIVRNPSKPMLNQATQQRTAPGSTFKMVTAAAGISEGVVTTSETISCGGEFDKIDPAPHCWVFPNSHGYQNMEGAIANSCNMFFYEVGYRLGESEGDFDNDVGIDLLAGYAARFGLDRKSGVEIEEAVPSVATRDVVRASIGQSNNGYTTAALARYAAAVASEGDLYDLTLLDHSENSEGATIEEYGPKELEPIDMDEDYWDSVRSGMRRVCAAKSAFSSLHMYDENDDYVRISAAGKTGTAQQAFNLPNHALFLGFAPYDEPEIAIAVRIPYGYGSDYASRIAAQVMQCYFDSDSLSDILSSSDIPEFENGD
ncbi:MAG TPA: penicillin-binding protein [Lachnospiraceae bacterium]|nr:penicillin-binding protein [Lachnospiraceae bacterium]